MAIMAVPLRFLQAPQWHRAFGVTGAILKEIVEEISMPLAPMFNVSLQEGIVLLELKEANIIPLFKIG